MAHIHEVIDDDPHFQINPTSRVITLMGESEPILIQNDHNSERFTFEMPKIIDGHSMLECNRVRVHFINISSANEFEVSESVYVVTDLNVKKDVNDTVEFTWLIDNTATIHVGTLNFLIEFSCVTEGAIDEFGNELTMVNYSWHTGIYKGITVSDGMDNSAAITGKYYDVLDNWITLLAKEGNIVLANVKESIDLHVDQRVAEVKRDLTIYGLTASDVLVQETGSSTKKVMSQATTTEELRKIESSMSTFGVEIVNEVRNITDAFEKKVTQYAKHFTQAPYDKASSQLPVEEMPSGMVEFTDDYASELDESYVYTYHAPLTTEPEEHTRGKHYFICMVLDYENDVRAFTKSELPDDVITALHNGKNVEFRIRPYLDMSDGELVPKLEVMFQWGVDEVQAHYVDIDTRIVVDNEPSSDYIIIDPGKTDEQEICYYFVYEGCGNLYKSDYINEYVVTANGIANITKTWEEADKSTYTISLDNGNSYNIEVPHGRSIVDVEIVERGANEYKYKITYTSGDPTYFIVPNGLEPLSALGLTVENGMVCQKYKV